MLRYKITMEESGEKCTHAPHALLQGVQITAPEIIDPVFAKNSQNARFLLSENERFGLVFVKTGSINSGNRKLADKSI